MTSCRALVAYGESGRLTFALTSYRIRPCRNHRSRLTMQSGTTGRTGILDLSACNTAERTAGPSWRSGVGGQASPSISGVPWASALPSSFSGSSSSWRFAFLRITSCRLATGRGETDEIAGSAAIESESFGGDWERRSSRWEGLGVHASGKRAAGKSGQRALRVD